VIKPSTTRALSGLLALGVVASALDVAVLAPSAQSRTWPARSRAKPAVELRLRESPGRVDVVIAGLGTGVRAVSRSQLYGRWSARLTGVDLGDRPFTPQQQMLSSSELLSVRLEPLDEDLQLIVKARMGERVPKPTIGSDGEALVVSFAGLTGPEQRSIGRVDLRRPGRVAQPVMAPPMRPRAVAPPLGDMAVGSMLISSRSFVQASGPPVTLNLNNASAKDALMSLARLGGYGFVFVSESSAQSLTGGVDGDNPDYPVTMSFKNERYDRALNSVLMASGLQGRLEGGTLLVGAELSFRNFGPQMSKVFRMNQVDVASASRYLGNLGASIQIANTSKISSRTSSQDEVGSGDSEVTVPAGPQSGLVDTYSSGFGPLMGLVGTTDSRLNTITLVGESSLVDVAQSYLKQIDLRNRQVAVEVQILNVNLDNDRLVDSSFSARMGNTFIVSESGKGFFNFGDYKPGGSSGTGVYGGSDFRVPGTYPDFNLSEQIDQASYRQPDNSFYSYLEAQLIARNAKTLAQPTLLVQEGQKATVETGEEVIVNVEQNENSDTGTTTYTYEKETSGLTLELNVDNIDDNGFITMNINPSVSIPVPAPEGSGSSTGGVQIFNLNKRELKSGAIRLRDGQTLILTGVITESQVEEVRKWPVLGDLPLLGGLFRQTSSTRTKDELVILVTPRVLNDSQGGIYGYGYQPSTDATRTLFQGSSPLRR